MESVIFRSATAADIDALLHFWDRAGENGSRPADRRDLLLQLLQRDPASLIVAEVDSQIAGSIIAGWDGWRANLYRLAVAPDLRGQGLGSRLLAYAEDRLRQLGAERFCAMVLDDNIVGQSLWSASGYQPQGEWRRWVKAAR